MATPEYLARVNKAIDFVTQRLDRPLNLTQIAANSGFSPYHFHRIFRSIMGETLNDFVGRQRLERALYLMSHDRKKSLTEVALQCGFQSQSDFSRSFKKRFGVPPSSIDISSFRSANRRDRIEHRNSDVNEKVESRELSAVEQKGYDVRIRHLPERTMAYIRVFDLSKPESINVAAKRLLRWAEARGFADNQWYGYTWDDPDIVSIDDLRYDIAVEVKSIESEGEVGQVCFPSMTVAEIEVHGTIDLEQDALDWLYGIWLPGSGYMPAHQPCFEAWQGRPFEHGQDYITLCIQMPVARLF